MFVIYIADGAGHEKQVLPIFGEVFVPDDKTGNKLDFRSDYDVSDSSCRLQNGNSPPSSSPSSVNDICCGALPLAASLICL